MGLRSLALIVLGFVVGAAVILFADGTTTESSVAATTPVAVQTGTASDGHAHSHGGTAALTGDTPCEQSGIVDPEGTGQGGHGHRGPSEWQSVDRPTRDVLQSQLAIAHQVAVDHPTVADAEAAGWRMVTGYVPCIGAHYINGRYAVGEFDPAEPAMLLYDGTAPDARIVGLSYAKASGDAPPEGFAGPNDPWHQHNRNGGLCIKGGVVVGGEATTKAECTARGGIKNGGDGFWMMHAWVADGWPSSWGVFSAEHPDLGGTTGDINATPAPATASAATKG
jgi:hypothetical protein